MITKEVLMKIESYRHILRHAVGADGKNPGYRNRYCADIHGSDHRLLKEMVSLNLVKEGQIINNGQDQYFYVTDYGCRFIDLTPLQREKAMEEQ